jgi:hypothetical protein
MLEVFSGLYIALPPHHAIHIPLPNLTVQSVYSSSHATYLTHASKLSKGLYSYNVRLHPPQITNPPHLAVLPILRFRAVPQNTSSTFPLRKKRCVTSTNQTTSAIAIITTPTPAIASTTHGCTHASLGVLSGMPTDIAIMSSTTSDQCLESA